MTAGAVLLWVGIMALFAGVVAPAAFGTLDREAAGRLVSALFPRYYAVGATLGGVALAGLAARALLARSISTTPGSRSAPASTGTRRSDAAIWESRRSAGS